MKSEAQLRPAPAGPSQIPTCARLWGVHEVAEFLGIPVATLYQWRHRGEGPPAMRVGRHLRFDPDRVRLWVSQQVR